MQIIPYLTFNGECEAAFKFYEQCLGGKIQFLMRYGESPVAEQAGPGGRDRILHVTLGVGDQVVQGSDAPPQFYSRPQGFSVALDIASVDEAERVFRDLSDGGTVKMPMQETFWAKRFGMAVDKFGTPWIVNCEKPMP